MVKSMILNEIHQNDTKNVIHLCSITRHSYENLRIWFKLINFYLILYDFVYCPLIFPELSIKISLKWIVG